MRPPGVQPWRAELDRSFVVLTGLLRCPQAQAQLLLGPAEEVEYSRWSTKTSLDLIHRTVDTQIHGKPVGTTASWSNPNTGNAGTIKLVRKFRKGNLQCEQVGVYIDDKKAVETRALRIHTAAMTPEGLENSRSSSDKYECGALQALKDWPIAVNFFSRSDALLPNFPFRVLIPLAQSRATAPSPSCHVAREGPLRARLIVAVDRSAIVLTRIRISRIIASRGAPTREPASSERLPSRLQRDQSAFIRIVSEGYQRRSYDLPGTADYFRPKSRRKPVGRRGRQKEPVSPSHAVDRPSGRTRNRKSRPS